MHELLISYANFEHGGRVGAGYTGGGGSYDFRKLVRLLDCCDEGWPDVLVLGEGDRYDFNGYEGAFGAAAAMRKASGRPYMPLPGSLPHQWGPFAPCVFIDPNKVVVHHWYGDERRPDFAERTRNLLEAALPGTDERFRVVAFHGDIYSGLRRLIDAQVLARFADPALPCAVLADWNCMPSGPQWLPVPDDLDHGIHAPHLMPYRAVWEHGPKQAGPHRWDTWALDFLAGWWNPETEQREGGVGFHVAAELDGVFTPTQYPRPNGRAERAIDHILVNGPMAEAMVPGSYTVHEPDDPQDPPSDHKRISARFRLGG